MRDAVVGGCVATSTPALRYRWSALRNDVPRLLELYSRSASAESSRASGEAWGISSPEAAAQSSKPCGHALYKARPCSVALRGSPVRAGSEAVEWHVSWCEPSEYEQIRMSQRASESCNDSFVPRCESSEYRKEPRMSHLERGATQIMANDTHEDVSQS